MVSGHRGAALQHSTCYLSGQAGHPRGHTHLLFVRQHSVDQLDLALDDRRQVHLKELQCMCTTSVFMQAHTICLPSRVNKTNARQKIGQPQLSNQSATLWRATAMMAARSLLTVEAPKGSRAPG